MRRAVETVPYRVPGPRAERAGIVKAAIAPPNRVEPQTAPPDAIHHDRLRPAAWPREVTLTVRIVPTSDRVVDDVL